MSAISGTASRPRDNERRQHPRVRWGRNAVGGDRQRRHRHRLLRQRRESFATVNTGGNQTLLSSATAISTTLSGGGENVAGGVASSTTVNSGGGQNVMAGGTASDTMVSSSSKLGRQTRGGTVVSATIGHGAYAYVADSGTASFTTVSGGFELIAGGVTRFTTVSSNGYEMVAVGGVASGTTVNSGGYQYVSEGGTSIDTTVSTGGFEVLSGDPYPTLYSPATASFTTVESGGTLVILPGGSAISTTSESGGIVVSAGVVVYTGADRVQRDHAGFPVETDLRRPRHRLRRRGARRRVQPGVQRRHRRRGGRQCRRVRVCQLRQHRQQHDTHRLRRRVCLCRRHIHRHTDHRRHRRRLRHRRLWCASGTMVGSGGAEFVYRSGTADDTTVSSGGFEVVSAGGFAVSTTVELGGAIDVAYLSYTSGGPVSVTSGDVLTVSVGGASYTQQLAGDYAGEHFQLSQDTGTGTLLTLEAGAPCYRAGTRILTERGEVAVEALRVGDRVRTRAGRGGGADHLGRPARRGLRPPSEAAQGLAGPRRRRRVRARAGRTPICSSRRITRSMSMRC